MKKHLPIPLDFSDAMLLNETGWPPDVLDSQPESRIASYILYRRVKDIAEYGGEMF